MGRKIWVINLLLAGLTLSVGWQSWLFWTAGAPAPATAPADKGAGKAVEPTLVELPAPPPPEEFRMIEEKNLFTQSRAPAPPPPPPSADNKPVAPPENIQERYILYGVVRLGPTRYFAVIRDRKTPNAKQRTFKVGDALPGNHILRKIEDQRVFIATAVGDTELRLRTPKGAEDTSFIPRGIPPARVTPPGGMPGVASPGMPPGFPPGTSPPRPGVPSPGIAATRPPRAGVPAATMPTMQGDGGDGGDGGDQNMDEGDTNDGGDDEE